jgi:glycosyltransferase involved in cell wall biosynthesis
MLLSICIPTYNRASLLRQTLAHLCDVKWPFEAEIVVYDNASTDDTARVLSSFPVRSLRQARTVDPIDNHFSVLRVARGEFAFYLGDDDAVIPAALAAALEHARANPEWIACFSPYLETEQGSDRVLHVANSVKSPFAFARGDFTSAFHFFMQNMYHPETPLVRTESFRRFVTRPRKMWYAYWLFASLLKRGGIGMLAEPAWKHRIRGSADDHPQLQWAFAVDGQDGMRLGLEYIGLLAKQQNSGRLPQAIETRLVEFFLRRDAEYAQVASRICNFRGDGQAALEFSARYGLWLDIDNRQMDAGSMEARIDAEIAKRRASNGDLVVVASTEERTALMERGAEGSDVVAREDLRLALSLL